MTKVNFSELVGLSITKINIKCTDKTGNINALPIVFVNRKHSETQTIYTNKDNIFMMDGKLKAIIADVREDIELNICLF